MNKIFLLMGKSASGKDAIYRNLLTNDKLHLRKVVMYTTRPKRGGETEGVQYFFRTEQEYAFLKKSGKIIEEREYLTELGSWHYFTADDAQIDLEAGSYLMIGTLDVFHALCNHFGRGSVVPIYIDVDDHNLLTRAMKREAKQDCPHYDEMCRRFLADRKDFAKEKMQKAGIKRVFANNGKLEKTIQEISTYITQQSN